MRHCGEQRGTDHAGDASVRLLQARVDFLEATAFAIEEPVETGAFAVEVRFNLRPHRIRIGAGKHCLIGKVEGIHRIELPELQVVARAPASLGEEFVEKKFHHQEGRAKVKPIIAKTEFCIAPADNILLFEHLNTKSPLRKKHGGGEAAGTGPYNCYVPLFVTLSDTHMFNICCTSNN